MSQKNIEYEDAYIIEEREIKHDIEEIKDIDLQENLTLDSLDVSEDEMAIISDYDKLKLVSEITKKKNDLLGSQNKMMEFKPKVVKREEVVEDYIRNFFTKYKLTKTLDDFNVYYLFNHLLL
jgi:hypothetical protein